MSARAGWLALCLSLASAPGALAAAEDAASGGLVSRIVEWFRGGGDDATTRPQPVAAPAAEAGAPADAARAPVTFGDVHRATRVMLAEIERLREATGVAGPPPEPDPAREGLAPVDVYAKTFEVWDKTARAQRRLGMIPAEAAPASFSGAAPATLHRAVGAIVAELRRIRRQLVVEPGARPAAPPDDGAATPAALYHELAHASLLLDALVGRPVTLNDVRTRILGVHDALRAIASALGVSLEATAPPPAQAEATPARVAQALLRAAYKAIALQTALGMDASAVPAVASERADAAQALDVAAIVLAEILRVGAHLGVEATAPAPERPDPSDRDAYAQALHTVAYLDALLRAAADAR